MKLFAKPSSYESSSADKRYDERRSGSGSSHARRETSSSMTISLARFHNTAMLKKVHAILKKNTYQINRGNRYSTSFGLAYDSRCLGEKGWSGVILRNLPRDTTPQGVINNLMKPTQAACDYGLFTANCNPGEPTYRILNIERPVKIRD